MIKNILIVTYDRDWQQCSVGLLPSISRFLPDATVKIIDNSFTPNIQLPKFANISCQLITAKKLLGDCVFKYNPKSGQGYGWLRQQICKIMSYKLFDHEFVAIDSELEILRNFIQWPERSRSRHNVFDGFADSVKLKFNINNAHRAASPIYPWIFDPKISQNLLEEFDNNNDFVKWFTSHEYPSEFVLYDIYQHRNSPCTHYTTETVENSAVQYVFQNSYKLDKNRFDFAIVDRSVWKSDNCH